MKSLSTYIQDYAISHQNPLNIRIHNICVPAIAWSLIGFLHTFALFFWGGFDFRLSHAAVFLVLVYYSLFKNLRLFVAMAIVATIFFASYTVTPYLRELSIAVFVIAWAGQFYGHKVEGKKPSFFEDLFFLLIGPVWVLHKAFPGLLKLTSR